MLSFATLACMVGATAAGSAITTHIKLNDGNQFPSINLGTCCGSKPAVGIPGWIGAGGFGIDTSIDYKDEADIATALKKIGTTRRSALYITTKITAGCGKPADCAADSSLAIASVKQSLKNLGTTYIDMILLHRPCQQSTQKCSIQPKLSNCTGPCPIAEPSNSNAALWAGLVQAKKAGLVKSIGVSNYNAAELAALPAPIPAINQCEMSIEGYDNVTLNYCQANGIVYESYGAMRGCPFNSSVVTAIANAPRPQSPPTGVSTAQVCLRWALQRGVAIAAGTGADAETAGAYAKENLGIFGFELTGSEMMQLNNLQLP